MLYDNDLVLIGELREVIKGKLEAKEEKLGFKKLNV